MTTPENGVYVAGAPCPQHGDEWVWFDLTCLACEAAADPARASELAEAGFTGLPS